MPLPVQRERIATAPAPQQMPVDQVARRHEARPRERTAVLEHSQYYELHGRVIDFLENQAGQSAPAA